MDGSIQYEEQSTGIDALSVSGIKSEEPNRCRSYWSEIQFLDFVGGINPENTALKFDVLVISY